MTITYPLSLSALASGIDARSIDITTVYSQVESRSPFSMQSQVQDYLGDMWALNISFPALEDEDFREVKAFFLALRGMTGTFTYGDPSMRLPLGNARGTPLVRGASQSGNILLTDGWDASITSVLKGGDYLQLGSRTYVVISDADSDASGIASLDIFPRLRESPADNEPLVLKDTKILWRLSDPRFQWSRSVDGLYQVTASAVEAI